MRTQSSRSSKARRSHSAASTEPAAPSFVASPSVARFVPYLGSAVDQRGTALRNPAREYVVSRNAAQRAMSASAAVDHAMVVSPRALPLPTPPAAASTTAGTASAATGSQLYTLRKLRAGDVLQHLDFPAAPSPAEVSRSIGRLGIVSRESASAGGGTDRKRSIGIASSNLQEKHLMAQHHGPLPLPPSAAVQAAAAAHRARIEGLALTAFPQPTPAPQRTMFDSPMLDPRRASGEGMESMSLAAQAGSATAADAAMEAAAPAPLGFQPTSDGDVLDIYFFLTDPACPIFRAADSAGAGLGSTTSAATAASSTTSSMLRAMQLQQMHRDSSGVSNDDGSGLPRSAATLAASAVAAKYSLDLLSLAGLVEAAGGSVRTALGYLQQIVPRGSSVVSSSAAAAAAVPSSNLLVPFDPFSSMSELIHTVRLMRERDDLASVPPPQYIPPGREGGEEATKAAEAAKATRWLYASNRRIADQPETGLSFLRPAPTASSAVRPLVWSAKDPVLEARDRERAARIAAQQQLHVEIQREWPGPPRQPEAPVEA